MSYGNAYSSLYVACNTKEQAEALYQKFISENPAEGEFEADYHISRPFNVSFDLVCREISRCFDTYIHLLDHWLKSNFKLRLRGSWLVECDDGNYKCEIHRGEISESPLDWLEDHSVDEINFIKQWVQHHMPLSAPYCPKTLPKTNFNLSAPKMNGGYVHASLYVPVTGQKQADQIASLYREASTGIFKIMRESSPSDRIIFGLKEREQTEPIDKQVVELDGWLKYNFSLELSGFWYRDSTDEFYRKEISHGRIINPDLEWLLDYMIDEIDQIRFWAEDQFPHLVNTTEPPAMPLVFPQYKDTSKGESFLNSYIRLGAVCISQSRQKELYRKFKAEKPGYGNFTLDLQDTFPFHVEFNNPDKPASCSLERSIINLYRWLKKHFDLQLMGFWLQYYPEVFRGEIHYGDISRRHLSWLLEYSSEEIRQISNWARSRFYPPENE